MLRYIMLTAILMATTNVFSQTNISSEKKIPSPQATVGGFKNGDEIAKKYFNSQPGIGIYLKTEQGSPDIEVKDRPAFTFQVSSFQLMVIRNGSSVFNTDNTGNVFNEKTRSFFNTMDPGDIVLFSGIKAFYQNVEDKTNIQELTLKPLMYIIK